MSDRIALTGMVLSASPVGEYDKRLVILTKEKGRVTAFARGARRPNSPLLAAACPFVFGSFYVFEGRSSYRVVLAEVKNYFRELTEDMTVACYGSYFLEVANYYTRENNDELQMLRLLYGALRALLHPSLDNRLVRRTFELKAMVINGEYPQVFACVNCGAERDLSAYLPGKNGLVCSACKENYPYRTDLHPSTVYTLQYIISSEMGRLFAFAVSDEVLSELSVLVQGLCRKYMDREFRSLEILETIS